MRELLIIILFFTVIFQKQILANVKASFLLAQEFPQSPIKPINFLPSPKHETKTIKSNNGDVITDVFFPKISINSINSTPLPAIILAVGIRLDRKDELNFIKTAQNFSKLGYVVVWPRSKKLIVDDYSLESPETFITAVKYLQSLNSIDKKRISIIGFSTGASVGLIAAEDPYVNSKLRSFIFFAGYYNLFDYLQSLVTKSVVYENKTKIWTPEKKVFITVLHMINKKNDLDVMNIIKQDTNGKKISLINKFSNNDLNDIKKINPAENIKNFKTPIFIIHDKNDRVIPYVESIKLYNQLPKGVKKTFLLTDYFDHVRPKQKIDFRLDKLFKTYLFYSKAISYL